MINNYTLLNQCNSDEIESLLHSTSSNNNKNNDTRPQPTIERLHKLFQILISHENEYRTIFDYLGIFRFNDFYNTLHPFANNTERLQNIYCLFQQYINISDNGHIVIKQNFISYLKLVSNYLSNVIKNKHLTWSKTTKDKIQKPVIILAAHSLFYDALQASMRTINDYFKNSTVAIYDLGLITTQLNMIKENCERCIIIPFPFAQIEHVAAHIRTLRYFAWKPIVVQDAVHRFGSIIYGDTSIRYKTSNFDRLLLDNLIRGFSCRELPGHYFPCFTSFGTLLWFHETISTFDHIYIAEAVLSSRTSSLIIDPLSRMIVLTTGLFSIIALVLSIVGTATYSWYYNQDSNGQTVYYNFFTQCTGNLLNGSSNCFNMQRNTVLGLGTQHAAGLLVVAICLLGLGMLIVLAMNFIQLTGLLAFIPSIILFLAALFMVAALAEGSRVTTYNNYSANLVETGHLLTILSMGLIAFASGRLHYRYYEF
ncbi:unnamed protein product [Rotaria sp. Silwood1]|nr:unnamed protein product [Rotaria sp. Silwood1]